MQDLFHQLLDLDVVRGEEALLSHTLEQSSLMRSVTMVICCLETAEGIGIPDRAVTSSSINSASSSEPALILGGRGSSVYEVNVCEDRAVIGLAALSNGNHGIANQTFI